jgi:hypothetical protein
MMAAEAPMTSTEQLKTKARNQVRAVQDPGSRPLRACLPFIALQGMSSVEKESVPPSWRSVRQSCLTLVNPAVEISVFTISLQWFDWNMACRSTESRHRSSWQPLLPSRSWNFHDQLTG